MKNTFRALSKFTTPVAPPPSLGFTLAEVLITLGIIGVVAALTIPTLINKYQEKVTVTKVKKMYSTLSNTYELYKMDNGPSELIGTGNSESAIKAYEIFAPYLKIAKDCGVSNNGGCLTEEKYKNMDGSERQKYSDYRYYSIALNDGSSLIFRGGNSELGINLEILYDINGPETPNQWGVDLFEFDVYEDSVNPNGYADHETSCVAEDAEGWQCSGWIIYKGNMDYLKK